jgi:Ca-activated chloride channel family protein
MRRLSLQKTTPLLLAFAAGCLSAEPRFENAAPPPSPPAENQPSSKNLDDNAAAPEPAGAHTGAVTTASPDPAPSIDTPMLGAEVREAEPERDDFDGRQSRKRTTAKPASRPTDTLSQAPQGGAGLLGTRGPMQRSKSMRGAGKGIGRSAPTPAEESVLSGDFEGREDHRVASMRDASEEATSTFAVDVDTAAYSIARRSLKSNRMPTPTLVRVEEFINFFRYDYDPPTSEAFSIQLDGSKSPVDAHKHLVRVGLQSKIVSDAERLPSNIVFLMDTSCSMTSGDKLAMAKKSMEIAVEHLGSRDQVAITTYAGGVSMVLPPTRVTDQNRSRILKAIRTMRTSGGTAMASGLTLAYQQAAKMLAPNSNTRIVVMSDGDANIGSTSPDEILKQVSGYVSEGVRLSTIGFGDGNYKDAMMETLANKGNGNYFYVDSLVHADRVFGRDLTKMLQDVAQDVKIQVEFSPNAVKTWRLVGYENRHIANQDFRNDAVDAGEIGAGHQVTALYEVELQPGAQGSLATVRVRSKVPGAMKASEVERQLSVDRIDRSFTLTSSTMKVAIASMATAELLRHSPWADAWTFDRVASILEDLPNRGRDESELLALVKKAKSLSGSRGERLSQY